MASFGWCLQSSACQMTQDGMPEPDKPVVQTLYPRSDWYFKEWKPPKPAPAPVKAPIQLPSLTFVFVLGIWTFVIIFVMRIFSVEIGDWF
jgi:hypothetical protein